MSKTKKSAKSSGRRSMKGKKGTIGAPAKTVKWPKGPFTMATLFARNSKGGNAQCELSLRNKVDVMVASGQLLALVPKKQPGGKVGRPKSVFVLKTSYVPSKHQLALSTIARLTPAVSVTPVVAATAPVTAMASPAPEAPATPAPVETVATPAVETSPVTAAIPASPEPAIG